MKAASKTTLFRDTNRVPTAGDRVAAFFGTKPRYKAVELLDIAREKLTTNEICLWVAEYQKQFRIKAKELAYKGLSPSVVVFAESLPVDDRRRLRTLGLILLDQQTLESRGFKTPEEFEAHLNGKIEKSRDEQSRRPDLHPSKQRTLTPAEQNEINSYPPDVTPEDVAALLESMNKSD